MSRKKKSISNVSILQQVISLVDGSVSEAQLINKPLSDLNLITPSERFWLTYMLFLLSAVIRSEATEKEAGADHRTRGSIPPISVLLLSQLLKRVLISFRRGYFMSRKYRNTNRCSCLYISSLGIQYKMCLFFCPVEIHTWGLAGAPVPFKCVSLLAVTAERASLVKTMLATQARGITLVYVLTCLWVVA